MSQGPPEILISDADVLIDFVAADIGVLEIMATKLWQLHVALPILKEVKALTLAKAEKVNIVICEPTFQELRDAAQRGGALSGPDKLCLAIAKGRGWSCLTNDRLLRRDCKAAGVRTIWGLEAMLILNKAGHLTTAHAAKTAHAIRGQNPHHITQEILDRFLQHLGP